MFCIFYNIVPLLIHKKGNSCGYVVTIQVFILADGHLNTPAK